ncbi:MAG: TatD family hydrolase [Defluviitaleaceae bacterium]|nr:TatD family hydrolase [Defluviitaleaceae bacterium]
MYVDSHAHYDFETFDADRDELLAGLPAAGVSAVVNVGESMLSSRRSLELAGVYVHVVASVGVHPHNVDGMTPEDLNEIGRLAANSRCVAIGEIGLDYHYNYSAPANQILWFERQLDLANRLEMPVIIHSREAARDTLEILRKHGIRKGVVHCFTDDEEAALGYAKLGLYIGIGGVITFPKAEQVAAAVKAVGLARLLIETDSPFMSPIPFRGKRNDSRRIEYICAKISELLDTSNEDVANATSNNASDLFNLGKLL